MPRKDAIYPKLTLWQISGNVFRSIWYLSLAVIVRLSILTHCNESRHSWWITLPQLAISILVSYNSFNIFMGMEYARVGSTVSTNSNPALLWYRQSRPKVMSPSFEETDTIGSG